MANNKKTEELIRKYFDAMNREDYEAVFACYSDNIIYEDACLGRIMHGIEETKSFYMETMPTLSVKVYIEQLITTEDAFATAHRFEGKHVADLPGMPATGKSFSVKCATIGTIANGKITRNTDYWNLGTLLAQLGLA